MYARADCPTEARLRALLNGSLRDPEADAITEHLDSCPSCRKQLDRLAAGSRAPEDLAAQLRLELDPDSPALRDVLDGLRIRGEMDPGPTGPPEADRRDDPAPEGAGEFPRRVGPYRVEGVVGQGGMGRVLKAYDPSLRRVVAIKVMAAPLAAHGTARSRFKREARAAAAVAHDHVVTIHGVDEADNVPYIVMQYVQGKSLQERIDHGAPLPLRETLRIGMQIASGLAAAHAQGIVHRDIKPSNILLENGVERVKITDFGLARVHDDGITVSGVITGTPQYMSPEQARGEAVDPRSDLFSLGGVLYAMCTGEPPFRGGHPLSVLKRVCESEPQPIRQVNPDVPDWLAAIIARLMAKDPAERFGSAQEVGDLLGRHLAHLQQPTTVPMPERVDTPAGTKRQDVTASERWARRLIGAFALLTVVGPGSAAVVRHELPARWPLALVSIGAAGVLLSLWAARPTRPSSTPDRRQHVRWNHGLLILAGLVAVAVGLMLQHTANVWPTVPIFHVPWHIVLLAAVLLLAVAVVGAFRLARPSAPRHGFDRRRRGFRILFLIPVFAGLFVVFLGVKHRGGSAYGPDSAYLVVNVQDPKLTVRVEGSQMLRREYSAWRNQTVTFKLPFGLYTVKAFKDGDEVYAETVDIGRGKTRVHVPGKGQVTFSVSDPELLVVLNGKPVAGGRPHEVALGRHHWLAVKKGTEVVTQGDVVVRADQPTDVRVGQSGDRSDDRAWVQLFNGRDLTGWKPYSVQPGYWHVENGAIVGVGGPTYLVTERSDFDDFRLRIEARVNGGAAGGVFFRVGDDRGKSDSPPGYEASILDTDKTTEGGTGSLVGFTKATGRRIRPGVWFTLEVIADGDHLVVKLNGETTTDVRDPKRLYRKGHIALRVANSLSAVEFRRVEVSVAPPSAPVLAASRKEIEVLKELVRQQQEEVRRARERDRVGAISPVELLTAESELLDASVKLAEAEGRVGEAVRLLKKIVDKRREEKDLVQLQVEAGHQPQTKLTEVGRKLAEAELKLIDAEKRLPGKGEEAIPPANP